MASQRPWGLRRAADTIFALISLLPLVLFAFFMWHFDRLHETLAQIGVLLALIIALLGFVIFRQMVDRISDRILDLNRVVEGKLPVAAAVAAEQSATAVPGLGQIAEIGDIAQAFSGMLRELRASTERLEDLVFKLGTLNDMVEMAARIPKIEDLLAHVLERTMRAVSATIGSIMLLDRERQVLRIAVGRGLGDEEHSRPTVEVKVGEGIAGRVVQMGEAVLVEDIEKDPRFAKVSDPKYGGGSFICMPLRVGDRIVGVVNLAKKERAPGVTSPTFVNTDLQFLNALMTYTAYAVDNARLFEEARSAAQRLEEVVEDQKLRLTLAQQQMLQAAKLSALGELVAGVAHELNNPLTVLIGTADLMEAEASPVVKRHLHLMRSAINNAQSVVRGLLTFGRRMPLQKAPVDLAELTEKVLALTSGELHVAEVRVRKDLAPDLPRVHADANQLQQVLVNLITNAKQAMAGMDGERRLHISVHRADAARVSIQVEDTGPGVAAEVIAKVFDPFVTTKSDGTGLGLSISYGIVREHGGTLTVESPPGRGAVFTVELPIEASTPPAEAAVARTA